MTLTTMGKHRVPHPDLGSVLSPGGWLGGAGGALGLCLTRIPDWEMEGGRVTP